MIARKISTNWIKSLTSSASIQEQNGGSCHKREKFDGFDCVCLYHSCEGVTCHGDWWYTATRSFLFPTTARLFGKVQPATGALVCPYQAVARLCSQEWLAPIMWVSWLRQKWAVVAVAQQNNGMLCVRRRVWHCVPLQRHIFNLWLCCFHPSM